MIRTGTQRRGELGPAEPQPKEQKDCGQKNEAVVPEIFGVSFSVFLRAKLCALGVSALNDQVVATQRRRERREEFQYNSMSLPGASPVTELFAQIEDGAFGAKNTSHKNKISNVCRAERQSSKNRNPLLLASYGWSESGGISSGTVTGE